ncbi:MAG: BON domain-containing protein [Blastocatellia bacterium]
MTYKTDEEIKEEVMRELRWDTRVEETEVGVTVQHGVVTLIGAVSSYGKKIAARDAAFRVHGVLDVANDIEVRLPGTSAPSDTDIARAVRQALEWDVLVPSDHIRSTVTGGWVTLDGDVATISEREDAERAVHTLRGVRGVIDHIRVRAVEIKTEEVRQIIEEALERRADRLAGRIQVSLRDGEVGLSGHVRSFAERRAVIGAVSHAPGVRVVNDHLLVQAVD